jgi:ABC-type nitrate/sulfonate/bicarbonate transport system substrate-binding protein
VNARYRRVELLTVDTLSRFALFLLFSLTGLKPAVSLAAPSSATTVISFAGLNERSGVLFVASDQGLFRKYGIDTQVVHVRSGPVGIAALASGDIQFHVGSATGASIGAMDGGLDLVFIAGLINRLDGDIVVNPRVQTPSDLKGKTLGLASIGGGNWMFTMLALEH